MIGFILNEHNDFIIDSSGDIKMGEGLDAYQQHLKNILTTQQYENAYDIDSGINYLGYVLGRGTNIGAWASQVLDAVNATPFVQKIIDLVYNVEDGNLKFKLTVDTDLGQITIKG